MSITITFKETHKPEIRTSIVKQILEACKDLDVVAIHDFIEDDSIFEKMQKYEFLAQLRDEFNKCRADGITELVQYNALCQNCYPRSTVLAFKGADGKKRFGLIFQPLISMATNITICTVNVDAVTALNPNTKFGDEYHLSRLQIVNGKYRYNRE